MAEKHGSGEIGVVVIDGTARSGKGTAAKAIEKEYPNVAVEETGIYYRAITLGLLNDGKLERDMSADAIAIAVESIGPDALSAYASKCTELVQSLGVTSLYADDVSDTVQYVSPSIDVRKAVKLGFTKRVEAVRDAGEHSVLVVDGRNLASVIRGIRGTRLVLRTFVYCQPYEAARRECFRLGLDPTSTEWETVYNDKYASISARNRADKIREQDSVRAEPNPINYWTSPSLLEQTLMVYAKQYHEGSMDKVVKDRLVGRPDSTHIPRIGAGSKAVREDRQIYFDTTPFKNYPDSIKAMVRAMLDIYDGALTMDSINNPT